MYQDSQLSELRANASMASLIRALKADEARWWDSCNYYHQRWVDGDQDAFEPKTTAAGRALYIRNVLENLERLTK